MPDEILTAEQVSAWLGVSKRWVLDHCSGRRRPKLPAIKMGRRYRFRKEAVQRELETWEREPGGRS